MKKTTHKTPHFSLNTLKKLSQFKAKQTNPNKKTTPHQEKKTKTKPKTRDRSWIANV